MNATSPDTAAGAFGIDAFALDERSVLAVAAAVPAGGGLYLRGQLVRQWQLLPGQPAIQAVDRFSLGLALWAPF